ncbi:MAG: biopolymer transporter ExbD [Planctomycetaceae bacterium]|nr:biopolymer transporter ExbD [Planctomycetales bacterium]MCB9873741.1 biopolymer transporter ExbD [Planctomycetaceae bacterium]MCB9938124.1 biopolymer transporter ExbD [Planctomycetaceae bacterium]
MPISFHCPSCNATRSAHEVLAGRKVRCPSCDALVVVPVDAMDDDGKDTVAIAPIEDDGTKTVMLERVEMEAMEVTEVIEDPPAGYGGEPPGPAAPPVPEDEAPRGIKRKGNIEDTEMDMTPMVDVTFLLLIFFMVTAAFTLQKSLQVPKPNPDEASETVKEEEEDDSDRVTVQVDAFNTYHVITADWEEEAPSVQDLLRFLRLARDGDSTGKIPKTLLVEANGESLHEKVVAALDAGSDTGFEEVLLATVEDE